MRAAPYARISREDEGNVDNTDIQIDECVAWVQEQGHELVSTYVDDNASAYSNARRPDYERLLRDVEANKIDIIVCTEPSRLNRNLRNSIGLIALAYTTDLQHIAVTDPERHGFDLSTRSGIQNALEAAIEDEKEVTRLSGRQKRKNRVRAKEGRRNGGPRPFGYEADGVTIRESEAVIIREIVRRLLDGESSRSIIMDLRQRGVKTPTGKEWHGYTLRRIISSPRICGIRTHLGMHHPAQWPAIISYEDWQRLQIIWRARARHGTVEPRRYLLTGLLFCGNCDNPMVGQTWHDTRRPGSAIRRYRCAKDEAYHHRSGCGKIFRIAEPIELLVNEAVLRRLDSPDFVQALGAQANDGELKAKIHEREHKRDHQRELLEDRARGILSRSEYEYAKHIIEDEIEAINRQLATMQSGRTFSRIPLDGTLRQVWEEADIDFKRDIIRLLVKKIIILPGRTQQACKINGQTFRFDPSLMRIVWEV
jgi:site-specific DNA recombinase